MWEGTSGHEMAGDGTVGCWGKGTYRQMRELRPGSLERGNKRACLRQIKAPAPTHIEDLGWVWWHSLRPTSTHKSSVCECVC